MSRRILLAAIQSVFLIFLFGCSYTSGFDYSDLILSYENLSVEKQGKDYVVSPNQGEIKDCIIFYPGAMVESKAYLPLVMECADKTNAICVLVHMPGDMAFNNKDAAKTYLKKYSDKIDHFYIAGHSLGGAMAGSYVSKQGNTYSGLILLGAYSTAKIPDGVNVLSIYGSEDNVLNRNNYKKYKTNLPENVSEFVIEGGNHGNFGNYGHQKKDGNASITNKEQQKITAEQIRKFCKQTEKKL